MAKYFFVLRDGAERSHDGFGFCGSCVDARAVEPGMLTESPVPAPRTH